MPCNSDYMNANSNEIAASVLIALIDEMKTGQHVDSNTFGNGYDKRVYGNKTSQVERDEWAKTLCTYCGTRGDECLRAQHSLEFQTWWRDHQVADKARIESESRSNHTETLKKSALDKLTKDERDALGI